MSRFLVADVFDGLATLDDGSVDLVVTSPPFLALRSYLPADHPDKAKEIGSEPTPAEFLDTLLAVTAELRRVLAPHGSIAIELGDTYAGSSGNNHQLYEGSRPDRGFNGGGKALAPSDTLRSGPGWPLAKSKTLIPELYRIALAYGFNPLTGQPSPAGQWRIRNVVTWCRPNPPVGALGDKWRPATSDVVVACVSGKRYWDDLATRKPSAYQDDPRHLRPGSYQVRKGTQEAAKGSFFNSGQNPSGAPLLDYWEIPLLDGEEPRQYGPKEPKRVDPADYTGNGYTKGHPEGVPGNESMPGNPAGAPLLDYWEIPPTGYAGSHYAVYPPELVVPLVKAMCPQKVCRSCGEPSRRIVESSSVYRGNGQPTKGGRLGHTLVDGQPPRGHDSSTITTIQDLGWTDCGHDDYRPGLVLDPFAGSGTTLMVAHGHGFDSIGIDFDERNLDLARERVGPFFLEEVKGTSDV